MSSKGDTVVVVAGVGRARLQAELGRVGRLARAVCRVFILVYYIANCY